MNELQQELRNRIIAVLEDLHVDCPECENIEDDQYQCGTCENGGGNGQISVVEYLDIQLD